MASAKVVLRFPKEVVDKPITSTVVKKYSLDFNILKAYITPEEEGLLVLEIMGEEENIRQAVDFVKATRVSVHYLNGNIVRDEDRCVHCGACVGVCPTGALSLDSDRMVVFDSSKCVVCGFCIKACIYKAIRMELLAPEDQTFFKTPATSLGTKPATE